MATIGEDRRNAETMDDAKENAGRSSSPSTPTVVLRNAAPAGTCGMYRVGWVTAV